MLEFARDQYLWLLSLVAVFFIVFFFARRWKKARVTYGFIWERVAKRVRPPTWKRLLKLVLTLLISGSMLSSAALHAAGLGPAKEEQPAPLIVFIIEDNSPSMRASISAGSKITRRDEARRAAIGWIGALRENDGALLIHFNRGQPVSTRWVAAGGRLSDSPIPDTDMALPDMEALARFVRGINAPPDIAALPAPQPLLVWLGDSPPSFTRAAPPARLSPLAALDRWHTFAGMPALAQSFGSRVENEAVVAATFKPAPIGSEISGTLEGTLRSGGAAYVEITSYREAALALLKQGTPYPVPLQGTRRLVLAGKESASDAFPWDDRVAVPLQGHSLATVAIVRPQGESPNGELRQGIELLIPGRSVLEFQAGESFKADIVVLDRVCVEVECKVLLCFGGLPPSLGELLPAREAKSGLFSNLENPSWLGFEVPNLQLLAGREAFALAPGHKLTALATHVEAGILIAAARGEREVLYVGYSPTQSNFLFVPEGPTLLQRWLNAVLGRERMVIPPFCRMDQELEIKLDSPEPIRLKLLNGWDNVIAASEIEIVPSPDGRARIGPFEQPGEYEATAPGRTLGQIAVYWVDEAEQALPISPTAPIDLGKLAPAKDDNWTHWFPEILLWVAMLGLLLEWLLWLAGITD